MFTKKDEGKQFIGGINKSLSKVINNKPVDKTEAFLNGISSSLSKVINNKPVDKTEAFLNGISSSLSKVINNNVDKSETFLNGISSSLSQVFKNGTPKSSTKRVPRLFGKPNVRGPTPMTEEKKLSIEEYIKKLTEIIESLNDIVITETLYNKNRDIIRSEMDCFDKTAKKQDCKKKSMNENKATTIVSDFKGKLDELVDSGVKNDSKIIELAEETASVIEDSPRNTETIQKLTDLETTSVVVKKGDEIKLDIIQTIIKQVLNVVLKKE